MCAVLIGQLNIEPAVFLAPLAGVSESPFRRLARELGCGAVVTEMISAEGLRRGQSGSLALLRFAPDEHPIIAQLFGHEASALAEAAWICERRGFDAIDINMGCPVPKVVRSGAGAALMRTPGRAAAIVSAVRKAVGLPVTVKMRAGWSKDEINVVPLARRLEQAGACALIVHPRTRAQGYSGRAAWSLITQVVEAVSVPVIGNGDLHSGADGARMLAQTGCAGIMIGRGALGNPWVFSALAGRPYPPKPEERQRVFERHLQLQIEYLGSESRAVYCMRKHLIWYSRGLPGSSALRRELREMLAASELRAAFAKLLSVEHSCPPTTVGDEARFVQTC
jgi:tRNA-dihydrouridine synthase B